MSRITVVMVEDLISPEYEDPVKMTLEYRLSKHFLREGGKNATSLEVWKWMFAYHGESHKQMPLIYYI